MIEHYTYKETFELRDEDDIVYTVKAEAKIERSYSPDVPYLKNGDPGYPGWDETEISELEYTVVDENGQGILPTDDWEERIVEYITNDVDNWQ